MNNYHLKEVLQWAKENDVKIDDRIEFRDTDSVGISCFAKENINRETKPLIEVPEKLLLTHKLAESHFNIKITDIKLSSQNLNALGQLHLSKLKFCPDVRDEAAMYLPYLNMLSINLEQPYFWSDKLLDLIKGTDLYLILKENIIKIFKEWIELITQLNIESHSEEAQLLKDKLAEDLLLYLRTYNTSEIKWNSFYAYMWSTCIFTSRAFPYLIIDKVQVRDINLAFLFPIVDLLNHKNDCKVKWDYNDENVTFYSSESIKSGEELYNNYGDKSNEGLLLNYGFIEERNEHDCAKLTLRIGDEPLNEAQRTGLTFDKLELVAADCVQFLICSNDELPKNLINLFGYLCKLKSEESSNIRSMLEGIDQLSSILVQKTEFFKKLSKIDSGEFESSERLKIQIIKKYMNSQRKLFNGALEKLPKLQKAILKESKEILSFKTAWKSDQLFSNSMLLTWGITNFEDLIKNNYVKEAILLWIVRISNQNNYKKKFDFTFPKFLIESFESISSSLTIEKEDVLEFMDFYKKLFPNLSKKIPEVFGQGEWGIKQLIIADTVYDNLVWSKSTTNEPIFIKNEPYKLK